MKKGADLKSWFYGGRDKAFFRENIDLITEQNSRMINLIILLIAVSYLFLTVYSTVLAEDKTEVLFYLPGVIAFALLYVFFRLRGRKSYHLVNLCEYLVFGTVFCILGYYNSVGSPEDCSVFIPVLVVVVFTLTIEPILQKLAVVGVLTGGFVVLVCLCKQGQVLANDILDVLIALLLGVFIGQRILQERLNGIAYSDYVQAQKNQALQSEIDQSNRIIQALGEDFECISYVTLGERAEEDTTLIFRISEKLAAIIPGWETEQSFNRRIDLLIENAVYPEERAHARELLNRDEILEQLRRRNAVFVDFRVVLDGNPYYYQMKCTAVRDEAGRLTNAVIGIHDVDEVTRRILQSEEQKNRADAQNRAKSEFLFNMSHDIRTPMNAILGFMDIAARQIAAGNYDRALDGLEKAEKAGNHMLRLVNDILELSRIESGKMTLTSAPMDIRRTVEEVQEVSQALALPKGIRFTTVTESLKTPLVRFDALRLHELLLNLTSNAIKYTAEGGWVTFTVSQPEEVRDGCVLCRFEVADNGIGMSEEFQQHLFEAFSREERVTVSKIEGAGVGLSIVKSIVDLAGGTVQVQSKLGEGSRFVVELPLALPDEQTARQWQAETAENAAAELPDFTGRRVLLVEDNELNREIAGELLGEAGFVVELAEDGAVAVSAVADKGVDHYDFILMDIQMPVMDGYEATRAIRRLPGGGRVPIIALSANAFQEDIDKSLASGMNDHVAKPIDTEKLFAAMGRLAG